MATSDRERDIRDYRWIGAAHHDIRPGLCKRGDRCAGEVRQVVHRPSEQIRAIVGGRLHADDLDTAPDLTCGKIGPAVEPAGDHGDIEVLRKPFTELREEVRGRLHAGPVVLIQKENARPHAAKLAASSKINPAQGTRASTSRL